MDDNARIEIAKQYLRRKYQNNLAGLKALASQVAETAFDAVTITGDGFEGGTAQGQITFEPIAYLGAIEGLIIEMDPDNTPLPNPAGSVADFSVRAITS